MKISIISAFLLFIGINGFSQNLTYEIRGKYTRPIEQEKLKEANNLSDIMSYYPAAWITSYNSVEVSAICDGTAISAPGDNEILNAYQKRILQTADLGSDVVINVIYKTDNAATREMDTHIMHYTTTIVPSTEAEYFTGSMDMNQYLQKNAIAKIPEAFSKDLKPTIVSFTVDVDGDITNAQVDKSSGDAGIDRMLLKAINKMPKWKPAQMANGTKVNQTFELSVNGNTGGC